MTNTHPLTIPTFEFMKEKFDRFTDLIYEVKNVNHSILNESLSMFEGQYEIAKYLAIIAYDMSKHKIQKNVVDVTEFNTWLKSITLLVHIDYQNLLSNFSASIRRIGTDDADIEVVIPIRHFNIGNSDFIKNKILYCITHELMHDNIFIRRYENGVENYDDTPENYQTYITIMRENDPKSLLYKFALALYSTFYQETQAIISQTSSNLRLILNKTRLTNDEIKDNIHKTEGYDRFQTILYDLVPILENMTDEEILNNIQLPLYSNYNLKIDVKKYIKKFKKVSEIALRKIVKSAMLTSVNL